MAPRVVHVRHAAGVLIMQKMFGIATVVFAIIGIAVTIDVAWIGLRHLAAMACS